MDMINQACERGVWNEDISKETIMLILKGRDPGKFEDWKPITQLNVAYKIWAKVPTNRLKTHIHHIVRREKVGFISKRNLLDNYLTVYETINWVVISRHTTIFVKLDFSKAYDRVT